MKTWEYIGIDYLEAILHVQLTMVDTLPANTYVGNLTMVKFVNSLLSGSKICK